MAEEDIQLRFSFVRQCARSTGSFLRSQTRLQNAWFVSHIATLLGFSLYTVALVDGTRGNLQLRSYALATSSMTLTFVIVMYRANFEEQLVINGDREEEIVKPKVMGVSELMRDENALLFAYVLLWDFTARSIAKLVPFVVYSTINLSGFFLQELIPQSNLSAALLPLFNYFEMPLLILASHFDLIVMAQLVRESIETQNAYPLVIYCWIWLLRYENSEISRSSVKLIVTFIDGLLCLIIVPRKVAEAYVTWRRRWTFMIPVDYNA